MTGTDRRVVRTGWCAKTPSIQRHPETNQGPLSSIQCAGFVFNHTPSSRHASLQPPTLARRRISPGAPQSGGAPTSTVCGPVLFSLIARTPPGSTPPNARASTRVNAVLDTVERGIPSPSLLPLEPPQPAAVPIQPSPPPPDPPPEAPPGPPRGRCGCQCCRYHRPSQPSATVADCLATVAGCLARNWMVNDR